MLASEKVRLPNDTPIASFSATLMLLENWQKETTILKYKCHTAIPIHSKFLFLEPQWRIKVSNYTYTDIV